MSEQWELDDAYIGELLARIEELKRVLRGLGRHYAWSDRTCYDHCGVYGHRVHTPECEQARAVLERDKQP